MRRAAPMRREADNPPRIAYSAGEVLEMLPIGKTAFWARLANGDIPSTMIAGRRVIPASWVEAVRTGSLPRHESQR